MSWLAILWHLLEKYWGLPCVLQMSPSPWGCVSVSGRRKEAYLPRRGLAQDNLRVQLKQNVLAERTKRSVVTPNNPSGQQTGVQVIRNDR